MTSPAPKPQGMIERVAEVIWLAHPMGWETFGDTPLPWHSVENIWGDQYLRAARAAIEAMREPTEAMLEARHSVDNDEYLGVGIKCANELWAGMIHAILAEKST